MKKTFLLSLFTFVFAVTNLYAQENFQDESLALMEDIARNSKEKNIVEFLTKAKFTKVSESEEGGAKSYYFAGPNSAAIKVDYNKSKKLMNVIMIVSSNFGKLPFMQTDLMRHDFKNYKYDNFKWEKDSYPFQYLTTEDENDHSQAFVYLITKESEHYKK
ncbi:hypothetical protein [Chryseobacterium caseinilyticum]|uniref:Uncharacterized protein n=1 Tax=Chryseobacterium caseinilyticum TaxID=2771428 RepID=A0ABR8Z7J7_9FLAO|nr:hypothetical protein [Chryseobacterium caseinilyticum]MBD8081259.1 hypothetical protein [Chryseobacterium caseinilyticum]